LTTVYRIGYCDTPAPAQNVLLMSLGYGSTQGNGRWHTKGPNQVVYCGSSRALCQLEKRVHANGANPKNQALMRLQIPAATSLIEVETLGLPADWRDDETATQIIGNTWVASGSSLGLWVPSCIEPGERNLLLNPAHPAYATVTLYIERHPFKFDPRLFIAPVPAARGGTSP
jgi:RES domain-containing protein